MSAPDIADLQVPAIIRDHGTLSFLLALLRDAQRAGRKVDRQIDAVITAYSKGLSKP